MNEEVEVLVAVVLDVPEVVLHNST